MAALFPRVVVVTRPTELAGLIEEHGTREQAHFAVRDEGRNFDELVARDRLQSDAETIVLSGLSTAWRRARIGRGDLATFAFDPGDVVVAIGQDGLVPNVAKYLDAQIVIGVNPDPSTYEGVLVRHSPREASALIASAVAQRIDYEERTMADVRLDDGQHLRALNEVFVGHRSHQSARYRLVLGEREERQSSSGLIVSTGTGATGWARSIALERRTTVALPAPGDAALALYVREAFPGPGFGTTLTAAQLSSSAAIVISEMTVGGVIFGDGIEDDFLRFTWGKRAEIRTAEHPLRLAGC
jgi:hypothetical protein